MNENTDRAATPWTDTEARKLTATARRVFRDHVSDHGDPYARENCAACSLAERNYAGWLRLYIAAGRSVPRQALADELARAATENDHYYRATLRDIATFGVTVL